MKAEEDWALLQTISFQDFYAAVIYPLIETERETKEYSSFIEGMLFHHL